MDFPKNTAAKIGFVCNQEKTRVPILAVGCLTVSSSFGLTRMNKKHEPKRDEDKTVSPTASLTSNLSTHYSFDVRCLLWRPVGCILAGAREHDVTTSSCRQEPGQAAPTMPM